MLGWSVEEIQGTGMWIIEATDLDVALKLTAEGSKVCNRKLELRPFHVHGK